MSELRLKPSKDALEDLIASAEGLNTEGADEETVAVFRSALARAMSVLEDDQATEAEVASAEKDRWKHRRQRPVRNGKCKFQWKPEQWIECKQDVHVGKQSGEDRRQHVPDRRKRCSDGDGSSSDRPSEEETQLSAERENWIE